MRNARYFSWLLPKYLLIVEFRFYHAVLCCILGNETSDADGLY